MNKKSKLLSQIGTISWIDWVQLFLIGLTAPFFLFPSTKYIWVLFIIPVIWICRWMIKKQFLERTVLDLAIVLLLIQVFATCMIVPDLGFSLPKITGVLFGIAFFYLLVAMLRFEKLINLGIIAFIGGGFLFSLVSILGGNFEFDSLISSLARTFGVEIRSIRTSHTAIAKNLPKINWNLPGAEEGFNPNAIGGVLIFFIPLSLVFLFTFFKRKKEFYIFSNKPILSVLFFIISFIMLCVFILNLSINSWMALIIALCMLLLFRRQKKWSLIISFLLVVFIFSLRSYKNGDIIDKVQNRRDVVVRKALWSIGINTISHHPLFGIGMNRVRQIPSVGYETSHVHNHLLHTGAELGIPGLVAYLAILISAAYMCIQIWRKSNKGWMRMTALGLGCGQLAHFIFGMADSIPLGAKVGIFFWISLGLIASIFNFTIKKNLEAG